MTGAVIMGLWVFGGILGVCALCLLRWRLRSARDSSGEVFSALYLAGSRAEGQGLAFFAKVTLEDNVMVIAVWFGHRLEIPYSSIRSVRILRWGELEHWTGDCRAENFDVYARMGKRGEFTDMRNCAVIIWDTSDIQERQELLLFVRRRPWLLWHTRKPAESPSANAACFWRAVNERVCSGPASSGGPVLGLPAQRPVQTKKAAEALIEGGSRQPESVQRRTPTSEEGNKDED